MSTGDKDAAADKELSALLDSALEDFGHYKNTDDELDSLMETMDKEAAQKAAMNFETLLKNLKGQDSEEVPPPQQSVEMTEEERKLAENFQKLLKSVAEAEISEGDRISDTDIPGGLGLADTSAFIKQLQDLSERDPSQLADSAQMDTVMNLLQTFLAKDIIYPPIKDLLEKFPEYLANHPELEPEKRINYEKQIDILKRICEQYEQEDPVDGTSGKQQESFERIRCLMADLQACGYPPEELVGTIHQGLDTDADSVDTVPNMESFLKANPSCSIM